MDAMTCEMQNGIAQRVKNIHMDHKAQKNVGGGGRAYTPSIYS